MPRLFGMQVVPDGQATHGDGLPIIAPSAALLSARHVESFKVVTHAPALSVQPTQLPGPPPRPPPTPPPVPPPVPPEQVPVETLHEPPLTHATQDAPPSPHWDAVRFVTQVLPVQQPFGHVALLHAPPVQVPLVHDWPLVQLMHALPPVPHALMDVPGWQMPRRSLQPVQVMGDSQTP